MYFITEYLDNNDNEEHVRHNTQQNMDMEEPEKPSCESDGIKFFFVNKLNLFSE